VNDPRIPQLASNFLAVAYSIADGDPTRIVWRVRRLQGWTMVTEEAAIAAAQYLVNAGFAFWGKQDDEIGIRITRAGWAEAEKQLDRTPEPHLPPATSTITITGSNIGGIQQGATDSVQTVHQEAALGPADVVAIRGFILEARQNLESIEDATLRSEVERRLEALEEETSDDEPRGRVIADVLEGLKTMAYSVAGSGTWQVLHPLVDRFI
jgi:hypothetical protein